MSSLSLLVRVKYLIWKLLTIENVSPIKILEISETWLSGNKDMFSSQFWQIWKIRAKIRYRYFQLNNFHYFAKENSTYLQVTSNVWACRSQQGSLGRYLLQGLNLWGCSSLRKRSTMPLATNSNNNRADGLRKPTLSSIFPPDGHFVDNQNLLITADHLYTGCSKQRFSSSQQGMVDQLHTGKQ